MVNNTYQNNKNIVKDKMSIFKKIKNFVTGQKDDTEDTVQATADEVTKTAKKTKNKAKGLNKKSKKK